ncbi:hypothetical protein ACHAXR_003876 [Thalassiosira sp. AJA248-18]
MITLLFHVIALAGVTMMISSPMSVLAFVSPSSPLFEGNRYGRINLHHTTTKLFHHHQHQQNNNRRTFITTSVSTLPILLSSTTTIQSASYRANAITPEQASKSYDTYAATYDNLDGGTIASSLGIDEARKHLLSMAKGNVLEIGVGTGLNLDSYQFTNIQSLTLVDISEGMLSQARVRIQQMKSMGIIDDSIPVKIVQADATSELTSLFGKDKFDTVVDTFSLCVMGNEGAKRCLEEMTGVVKKGGDGGQVLLIENTRASNPLLGYYQDITASTAADVGGKGCVYNQNVGEMIQQTKGLKIAKEEAFAAGLFRAYTCQKT